MHIRSFSAPAQLDGFYDLAYVRPCGIDLENNVIIVWDQVLQWAHACNGPNEVAILGVRAAVCHDSSGTDVCKHIHIIMPICSIGIHTKQFWADDMVEPAKILFENCHDRSVRQIHLSL